MSRRFTRKQFLLALGGAALGAPLAPSALAQTPKAPACEPLDPDAVVSYAQSGEDIVANYILRYLKVEPVNYLDVGTWDPIKINNTYFFYRQGRRGVLVEPNVDMAPRIRSVRPKDTLLVAGIGVTAVAEADYYVMTEPSWNTFSKKEAEHSVAVTKGKISIVKVVKMPLLNINDVMQQHFGGAPAFLSVDAEGLHLAILKSVDYKRFRPKVICVETRISGTNKDIPEIPAFMKTKGYVARGGSFVNTIFIDSKIL